MASSPRLQKPRRKWRGDHLRNRRAFFGGVFDLAAISGDTSGSCAPSGGTATGALVASEDFRAGTSLSRYGSLAIDADGNWTYTSSTSLVGVSDTIAVATVDGRRAVISILVRGRLFYEVIGRRLAALGSGFRWIDRHARDGFSGNVWTGPYRSGQSKRRSGSGPEWQDLCCAKCARKHHDL
jgi:VCBS repeat-containing protein